MSYTPWPNTIPQEPTLNQLRLAPELGGGRQNVPAGLAELAQKFAPITLTQMDAVALLNRTDTKFVLTAAQLLAALQAVQPDYRVLSVNGQRLNHYRTLYFDTPDFELYRLHVNGRADRYKVRTREYTDSSESFLEVKHKTPKGRTIKERIPTAGPVFEITLDEEAWLNGMIPYDSRMLGPKLWNTFTRITLVSKHECERVTVDVDLGFSAGDQAVRLNGLVVAEVKKDVSNCPSAFLIQMRSQHIQPRSFSKYVIGVSMLYEQVKKNALKPKMLLIEKLTRGY